MNKQQMLDKIDALPLFRERDVAVKDEEVTNGYIEETARFKWHEKPVWKAITEVGRLEPFAFVGRGYKLIQFKEMFKPLAEQIEHFDGRLEYWNGFAIMDIFPTSDEFKIDSNTVGIVAYNSVNKTCGLNIRFCVGYGSKVLTIPSKVASFRKKHVGNVDIKTGDYISMVSKIKVVWNDVVTKFALQTVTTDELTDYAESFELDDKYVKKLKKKIKAGVNYNLWELCMNFFEFLTDKEYKSEVHKRKRLDRFVSKIFDYQLVLDL